MIPKESKGEPTMSAQSHTSSAQGLVGSDDSLTHSLFEKHKLSVGRIFGSKTGYHRSHPKNIYIPNANICTKEHGKIWYGDLDLTVDAETLKKISKKLKTPLYVFYEMDARWKAPEFIDAIFEITNKKMNLLKPGYDKFFKQSKTGVWHNTADVATRYKQL
jgi:hypothetical protein